MNIFMFNYFFCLSYKKSYELSSTYFDYHSIL